MILTPLDPTPARPTPTLRVVRVVTEDANRRRRNWTLEQIMAEHPELFTASP